MVASWRTWLGAQLSKRTLNYSSHLESALVCCSLLTKSAASSASRRRVVTGASPALEARCFTSSPLGCASLSSRSLTTAGRSATVPATFIAWPQPFDAVRGLAHETTRRRQARHHHAVLSNRILLRTQAGELLAGVSSDARDVAADADEVRVAGRAGSGGQRQGRAARGLLPAPRRRVTSGAGRLATRGSVRVDARDEVAVVGRGRRLVAVARPEHEAR